MNNHRHTFLQIFLSASLLIACTKVQKAGGPTPVDLVKLEQIKKALAEKANAVNAGPTKDLGDSSTLGNENQKIVAVRLMPPSLTVIEGLSEKFSVYGRQADGKEISLTQGVDFSVGSAAIIALPSAAENSLFNLKTLSPGRTALTVTTNGLSVVMDVLVTAKEVVSIDVFPKSVPLGTPTRFHLNVIYNNETQAEVNTGVAWQSAAGAYLQFDGQSATSGIFTGAKVGFAGLKATYSGQSIVSRTEITMPKIAQISVQSEADTFLLGTQVPMRAIATFASGNSFEISSSVVWLSSDLSIGTVTATGDFEAIFPGDVLIKATYGTASGQSTFYVTSVNFANVRIEALNGTTPAGLSTHYKMYGIKLDNSEMDITAYTRWTSSDTFTAISGTTLSPKQPGYFVGVSPNTANITARYGTFTRTLPITVTDAAVLSLAMTSDNTSGQCGINSPAVVVNATMSDGNSKDLTGDVIFTVDPPAAATPSTDPLKKGVFVTTQAIAATIIAKYHEAKTNQDLEVRLPITITPGKDLGVGITAPMRSIAFGDTLALLSGQVLSCGVGANYTDTTNWSTDNSSPSLNSLINTTGSKGFLASGTMLNPPAIGGTATIKVTAVKGTDHNDITITVRPKEVRTVSVTPVLDTLDVQGSTSATTALRVDARYSDSSSDNMSDISLFPGYALVYGIEDCLLTGCASINTTTGVVTPGTQEGIVKVFATLTTPLSATVVSSKVPISIQSKCTFGTIVGQYCLSLGVKGQSCTQTCSAHGTYHPATGTVFGKDGLAADCDLAIKAFGQSEGLVSSNLNKGKGLGCSIWNITNIGLLKGVREGSTPTNATDVDTEYQRICACREN